MSNKFDLGDYVEVHERMVWFFEKYPTGSLQSELISHTDDLVVMRGFAYRTDDDIRPGMGVASEPIPGTTPYTRNSEVMNAETSAWGRAIAAIGGPTRGHVATKEDVEVRRSEKAGPPTDRKSSSPKPSTCPHGPTVWVTSTPSGKVVKAYCPECSKVIEL